MGIIAGIDLGTTFSGLAILNDVGKPEIVPNAEGERITASALYFEDDAVLVGGEALNARMLNPERLVCWIKRHMGEDEYPDEVVGRKWTPAELSSLILRKLKQDCGQQVGEITNVIITVPAYFDEIRRKATMDAGKMAGLNVMGIVNEPTAAALYYATTRDANGRVLAFDLGGGTFDVTVMDVDGQNIQIVCSRGHHQLGGYDFDQKIIDAIGEQFEEQHGRRLFVTTKDRTQYEDKAEDGKRTLSKRPVWRDRLIAGDLNFLVNLSRESFEERIAPHLASIDMLVETALDEADCSPSDIGQVLLVGGSTRMPIVQKRLEKMFGFPPTATVNVDECVALGAAICAGVRTGAIKGVGVSDACSYSFGTICLGLMDEQSERIEEVNDTIIPKNTKIPAKMVKTYYTAADGQTAVRARLTQGEGSDPHYVNILRDESLPVPPNRPAGRPVEVTYEYDVDQRMHCIFKDVESGEKVKWDMDMATESKVVEQKATVDKFQVE